MIRIIYSPALAAEGVQPLALEYDALRWDGGQIAAELDIPDGYTVDLTGARFGAVIVADGAQVSAVSVPLGAERWIQTDQRRLITARVHWGPAAVVEITATVETARGTVANSWTLIAPPQPEPDQ